ncbi:MAG: hypothetical protein ACHQO8_11740 [Vicinamibacterales bacterium]
MRTLFIVTLFVALAILAEPLRATVVVPADLGELTRDARAIVRGRVVSVDGRWTEDRRTIETIVTIEVATYLKGALGPTLQFRVPGGDLGRYRSIVVGAPLFAVDEQIVVFLGANGPAVPYILGFNQGVYRIARAADNSGWLVTPPALLPSVAGTTPVVRGDPSRRPLPLADFEQRVRALAGGAK